MKYPDSTKKEQREEQARSGSNRSPAFRITRNFFLHIHSPRVHLYSLRPTFTFGLGVMAGFLFLILLLTGVLLMLYYTPSVERAYASVKDIIFVVPGGRIIRNMHRWAGHGLVLVAFLHLWRVFYTAAYAKGRSLNWIIGVSMLVVVLFLSFSGYLLPWDQLAYWAVTIGANIAASVRELTDALNLTGVIDIGGFIKKVLIGGETVGQEALTRFYMLHIVLLPLTMLTLIGVHFWRIRKKGGLNLPEIADSFVVNTNPGTAEKKVEPKQAIVRAWPTALWGELAALTFILAVLMVISFFVDAPLREIANPATPENPAKSPWYFLGVQELVSYSAFSGGVLVPLGFAAFLISIPFVDRETKGVGVWFSGSAGRRIVVSSLLFSAPVAVLLLIITVRFGWLRDWLPHIPQAVIILVNPGTLMTAVYALWATIIRRKTESTRFAALALFTCVMTGFIIMTVVGVFFRGPDWGFYWSPLQWPRL